MKVAKSFALSSRDRNDVKSMLAGLLEAEPAVQLAYLYGSFVESDGFNDIDVAVWLDKSRFTDEGKQFDYQLGLAVRLERETRPFPVDLMVLNDAPLPLRFKVICDGECLYSRDETSRLGFESHTRMLFFDFIPHLNFYYQKLVLGK